MEITYKEIEEAIITYRYINKDLWNGISYDISTEVYDKCMKSIRSPKRANDRKITSMIFIDEFYPEYEKLRKKVTKCRR